MRHKSMLAGFILAMMATFSQSAVGDDGPRRGISVDRVLRVADGAIGYPQGRPENVEVITAKLFAMKHQDLTLENVPGDPEALLSKLKGKEYWLVQYRKWPIRLDGGLAVFVDSHSGEVISVSRDR